MSLVANDKEFSPRDEGYIVKVNERDEIYEVTWDGDPEATSGWTFLLGKEELDGLVPRLGQRITIYGGIGFPIRGVDLDGEEIYYRDPIERELRHAEMVHRQEGERFERFRKQRDVMGSRYDSLPEVFRGRIDKFVETKGPSWWWSFGEYELNACVDAVLIAQAVAENLGLEPGIGSDNEDIAQSVGQWFDDGNAEKVEGTFDGHSGNSWGFAKRLAYLWILMPDLVRLEHGALTPLVGCEEYGCSHPGSDQE